LHFAVPRVSVDGWETGFVESSCQTFALELAREDVADIGQFRNSAKHLRVGFFCKTNCQSQSQSSRPYEVRGNFNLDEVRGHLGTFAPTIRRWYEFRRKKPYEINILQYVAST
jgi:hypothetical protein